MKEYLKKEEWKIVERGFHPDRNPETEKLFCIGNGFLWQSGSFAEYFSGASQSAAFVAGQPAPHWIGLDVKVDGEVLDLNHAELYDFERTLHLKEGFLERSFEATLVSGKKLKIKSRRFCSMADPTIGVLGYEIEVLNFSGKISITSYVDGENKDENIHYPWQEKTQDLQHRLGYLT